MLGIVTVFAATLSGAGSGQPAFVARHDERRHEVVLRLGPLTLPPGPESGEHAPHAHHQQSLPLYRFEWPVRGWLRGFRLTLSDSVGRRLSGRLVHHVNLLSLERRNLMDPIIQRTLAIGQETGEVLLPKTVGMPVEPGAQMALLTALRNESPEELRGLVLELTLAYLPQNLTPRPVDAFTFGFDVGFEAGSSAAFDLAPGRTEHQREFVFPLSGRLLAAGAHLHDHAESIQLFDAVTGKLLLILRARKDERGRVLAIPRKLFGVTGRGLRLEAGKRYRVVVVYQNPLDHVLPDGGMGLIVGLLAPDDSRDWPALNPADPEYVADIRNLRSVTWVEVPPRPR